MPAINASANDCSAVLHFAVESKPGLFAACAAPTGACLGCVAGVGLVELG